MSENKIKTKTDSNKLLDPKVEYITRNFFAGLASFWFGEAGQIGAQWNLLILMFDF